MRTILSALAVTIATSAVAGQADPRALKACQKTSKAFTKIAECLPDADVAVRTLDAFSTIYPAEAAPLKDRCTELNADNLSGAAACVTNAIESGLSLRKSLPAGSDLSDPIFAAVADDGRWSKLESAIKDARAAYPDKMIWGMTLYQPYR
ncbi:exported hypothetical protein [Mesorhizobium plurifarium]|uniref:Secreted protein n=1 Tax=Mesorhizobium plurifarium TaxID=69974 RepID=A0A0K2W5X1_MESPL|nr:exported hypothetical protein [Mesorhizobium plurifarium]